MVRTLLLSALFTAPAFAQTADVIREINGIGKDPPTPPATHTVESKATDRSLRPLPPPQKPIPVEQVKPLLEALASKDFKVREKAHRDLLAADDRVIPHLEEALAATDSPEAERRLEVIVERLRQQRAVKPTRVNVSAKNASPKAVLKDICRQAGYTLVGEFTDAGKVSLELTDVPFWVAVEKVCEPLGLQAEPTLVADDRGGLSVYTADTVNPFTHTSGPFRFVASNISSSKSVQLGGLSRKGGDPASESLAFSGQLYAEPKLPIVSVGPARLTTATDDKGASLIDQPDAGPSGPLPDNGNYRTLNQSFSFNLARGHKDATTIKELRGVVPVRLLTDVKVELEVDDILTVKGKKYASRSCDLEVQGVDEGDGRVLVKLVFTPRGTVREGDDEWWSRLIPRLVLTDDKGVRFVNNGVSGSGEQGAAASVMVQFTPPDDRRKLKPSTLMLTYWVTAQKDVEFVFKNVPLP